VAAGPLTSSRVNSKVSSSGSATTAVGTPAGRTWKRAASGLKAGVVQKVRNRLLMRLRRPSSVEGLRPLQAGHPWSAQATMQCTQPHPLAACKCHVTAWQAHSMLSSEQPH
jgi:hypothetical protein